MTEAAAEHIEPTLNSNSELSDNDVVKSDQDKKDISFSYANRHGILVLDETDTGKIDVH